MDQIQREDSQSEVSIPNLPLEILEMVLKNLDIPSLFACRLVCRKLKLMCTPMLHDEPETELFFDFSSDTIHFLRRQDQKWEFVEKEEKDIQDFIETAQGFDRKSPPFTRFTLLSIKKWDDSVTDLLDAVKETATCLKLEFTTKAMADPHLNDKLRKLILHETPQLKEFGLQKLEIPTKPSKAPKVLKLALFPSSTKDSTAMKLPKLKVLNIGTDFQDESTVEIVGDILRIAENLERIQFFDMYLNEDDGKLGFRPKDFIFFFEYGKLHTLKNVTFDPIPNFLSDWKNALEKRKFNTEEISSLFKIEYLELVFDELFSSINPKRNPTKFKEAFRLTEQILEGSKNTLETFYVTNFAFPPGFSLPTFTKLSTVLLSEFEDDLVEFNSLFPPECRSLDIFSTVGTLGLEYSFSNDLKRFFPREDSTPVMPTVHTISFEGVKTKGEDVEIMALLCPNVKTVKHLNQHEGSAGFICGPGLVNFPSFALAVWKKMKNLECLQLNIDADAEDNFFPAMDSSLTGISKENCLRLFEETTDEDVQALDDNHDDEPQIKLTRESELKGLKVEESILDLPKLKELSIKILSKFEDEEDDEALLSRVKLDVLVQDGKPFKCDFPGCSSAFSYRHAVVAHKKVYHPPSGVLERKFKCDFENCHLAFLTKSQWTKHLAIHRGEKKYLCGAEECGASFLTPSQLKQHAAVHATETACLLFCFKYNLNCKSDEKGRKLCGTAE